MNNSTPIRARRTQGQRMKRNARRDAKRIFLESYALQGLKAPPRTNAACEAAEISRSILYQWLKTDPLFQAKYQALQAAYFTSWYFCPAALHDPEFEQERRLYTKQKHAGQRLIRYYQKRQALR